MIGVLVTRPKLLGSSLSYMLKQEGYTVWDGPVLTIVPQLSGRPNIEGKPIVVMTSRSVAAVVKENKSAFEDLFGHVCYCVGEQTAADIRACGFKNVQCAEGNAYNLALMLMEKEGSRQPILHICGEDRSEEPDLTLKKKGWTVQAWNIYKAEEVEKLTPKVCEALTTGKVDAVLLYSTRTAKQFVKLIRKYQLEACCQKLTAIGLSDAVIRALDTLPIGKAYAAKTPKQEDVVDRLREVLPTV